MEFFSADIGWLFFAYAVGSAVGWYLGKRSYAMNLAEDVIDSLIEQGFLKVKGTGDNMEIIKHTDWCENDQTPR